MSDSAPILGRTISHYRIIEKLGGGVGVLRDANGGEGLGGAVYVNEVDAAVSCIEYINGVAGLGSEINAAKVADRWRRWRSKK